MSNFTTMINTTQRSFNATTEAITGTSELRVLRLIQLTLMILIASVAAIGNLLVLMVLMKGKNRTKTSTVLLINLAICDTLMSVVCLPLDITSLILQRWVFGDVLCKVIYPFQTSLPIVSSYTLVFMLLERYMIFANRFRRTLRRTKVRMLAGLTWLLSVSVVVPYGFKLYAEDAGSADTSCNERWDEGEIYRKVYTVALSVIEYLIPMPPIIILVSKIVGFLRKERNLVKMGALGLGRQTSLRRMRIQRRLSIIFIVMVVTYGLLKLPNNIFWQLMEFGNGIIGNYSDVVHMFVGLCAYSTCVTNPFILLSMSSEFRKDIQKMFIVCDNSLRTDSSDDDVNRNTQTTSIGHLKPTEPMNGINDGNKIESKRRKDRVKDLNLSSPHPEEFKRLIDHKKRIVSFKKKPECCVMLEDNIVNEEETKAKLQVAKSDLA